MEPLPLDFTNLFQKLKRFEKSLEKHNTSPELAMFWNEIAEMLFNWEQFIDNEQWESWTAIQRYQKLLSDFKKHYNLINSANRSLRQLESLDSSNVNPKDCNDVS